MPNQRGLIGNRYAQRSVNPKRSITLARCVTFGVQSCAIQSFPDGPTVERIRPLARVLEVIDIMAEPVKTRGVLRVIPGDAAEPRMLGDQAGDDDAKTLGRS